MSKDKREGWLLSVKVGEEVIVERKRAGIGFSIRNHIGKVKKVTPTGRLEVEVREYGLKKFNQRGLELGPYGDKVLLKVTPDRLTFMKVERARQRAMANAYHVYAQTREFRTDGFDWVEFDRIMTRARQLVDSHER